MGKCVFMVEMWEREPTFIMPFKLSMSISPIMYDSLTAEVRGGKYPHIKEIVVDRNSDGVSTLLIRSEAVDSL
jgi:hypothetical protein